MTETASPNRVDRGRVRQLLAREEASLNERTPISGALYERARHSLVGGVPSSYQSRDPWPIYLDRADGARVWDVDGHEYVDFHNGFGAMVAGHANPVISEAVSRQVRRGTHFAAPTEDGVWVAEELARRFGLPQWRFTNSGTESTMDAIRIARAYTGRDTILKIFGSYHGHHDYAMVDIWVEYDNIGDRENYPSLPYGAGIPKAASDLTIAVPYNDAAALERRIVRLEAEGRAPACLIMEAAMMNLGVILPRPGYLEAVGDICRRHGILWIVDEVKTGLAIAAGGACEYFGIRPDMVTLAKALGGGLPSGAIGGTAEVMEIVRTGKVYQVGTFNGNPLVMAAARASLEHVLTPDAYAHLQALEQRLLGGLDRVMADHGIPGYAVGIRSKGFLTHTDGEITDYASFMEHQDKELAVLGWAYNMNRGIYPAPGREAEWTFSVRHTTEDVDRYVAVFEELAGELTGSGR